MKTKLFSTLSVLVMLLSCDSESPAPAKAKVILPSRLELDDYKRELVYDDENRLTHVKTSSFFPSDVVLTSITEYRYDNGGHLESTETDTGFRLVYTWENGRIRRTDQFINDAFTEYYTFSYDGKGRLREYITWQDIPEQGGEVPTAKTVYVYDNRDNVIQQFQYYYDTGINGHALLSSFEYDGYDSHSEGESLFDAYAINPQILLRKNNPGSMTTRNAKGNVVMVDEYTYVYNAEGYPVRKTTTSFFPYNGSGGSYDTFYYWETR